jgi:hypothetical protein
MPQALIHKATCRKSQSLSAVCGGKATKLIDIRTLLSVGVIMLLPLIMYPP